MLSQLGPFLAHSLRCAETRLVRLGLCEKAPSALSKTERAGLLAELAGRKLAGAGAKALLFPLRLFPAGAGRRKRLTETYLDDPAVRSLRDEAEPAA